jgi:hypothetical protein
MQEIDAPVIHLKGIEMRADQINPPPGNRDAGVWCRNIEELCAVITHGGYAISPEGRFIDFTMTQEDALLVADYLVRAGKAEEVVLPDGTLTWNIHHYGTDEPPVDVGKR